MFYLYFIDFIQVNQTLETVQKEKIKSRWHYLYYYKLYIIYIYSILGIYTYDAKSVNTFYLLKGNESIISRNPLYDERCQCPIHNGNFKSYVWSKNELDINVFILKTDYFQIWVLYISDLRISTAGKHKRIIRIRNV